MKLFLSGLAFLLMLLSSVAFGAEERMPVSIGEASELPLRVLTRPMSTLYKDNTGVTALESNLPAFQAYFVYTRPAGEALDSGTGWYEVGTDDKGKVVGWLKGDDIFEWRQTMCLAFTHPEGRKPVLMFEDEGALAALTKEDAAKRATSTEEFYKAIDGAAAGGTTLPAKFPVISVEPKMAVDITKQFYLLPILEHKSVELDGREGRLLRIAAVSGSGEKARESSDLRSNAQAAKSAAASSADNAKTLENLKIDFVWVIDTTRSMGPYITKATEVMRSVSKNIAVDPKLTGKIAFGAWAYRDSTTIADIEYQTKNFTPELQPVDAFLSTMDQIKETPVDSVDMAEDLFAGVADAIQKTAWRPGAIRVITIIADAPSHEAGHKWNSSGQDENTLRVLATESHVTIMALHLMPPRTAKYNKIAEKQLTVLSRNEGTTEVTYWGMNANNMAGFEKVTAEITAPVTAFAGAGAKALAESDPAAAAPAAPQASSGETAPSAAAVANALRAAAVQWIGSQAGATPPRDIEAWVTDKDLSDASKQSLEVRLLLNKRQLDSLATLLNEVLQAGRTNQISGESFFNSLQAASAVASRNPDLLANAPNLEKSGLIPDFLSGLPYHSQLMDMNNDLWSSWGPDEQDGFLNAIEAKVKAYTSIHDNPELWVALNKGDDASENVAPVPLELLP
jgi:hypothetical protein